MSAETNFTSATLLPTGKSTTLLIKIWPIWTTSRFGRSKPLFTESKAIKTPRVKKLRAPMPLGNSQAIR